MYVHTDNMSIKVSLVFFFFFGFLLPKVFMAGFYNIITESFVAPNLTRLKSRH